MQCIRFVSLLEFYHKLAQFIKLLFTLINTEVLIVKHTSPTFVNVENVIIKKKKFQDVIYYGNNYNVFKE